MRKVILLTIFGLSIVSSYAQSVRELTTEISKLEKQRNVIDSDLKTKDNEYRKYSKNMDYIQYAGKDLQSYTSTHTAGNIFYLVGGVALFASTKTSSKDEAEIYMTKVTGGLFILTGYILNQWVAPNFIRKAGIKMNSVGVYVNLD